MVKNWVLSGPDLYNTLLGRRIVSDIDSSYIDNTGGLGRGQWQYFWYLPHNFPGLIELLGGRETFVKRMKIRGRCLGIFQETGGCEENPVYQIELARNLS